MKKFTILFVLLFCIFFFFNKKEMNDNRYKVIGAYHNVKSYEYISDKKFRKDKNYIKINKMSIYTGIKWECVEYIRRFFIKNYHITFRDVKDALDMTSLKYFYSIFNHSLKLPVYFIPYNRYNILSIRKNDIIIFSYKKTGHVALVTNVSLKKNYIEIVEQNWEKEWESNEYSRIINVYDPNIIGWLTFNF